MPSQPKPCPYCGKPASDVANAPFCGRGCKDRDLLKWLGEGYRIPGPPVDPEASGFAGVDSDRGEG